MDKSQFISRISNVFSWYSFVINFIWMGLILSGLIFGHPSKVIGMIDFYMFDIDDRNIPIAIMLWMALILYVVNYVLVGKFRLLPWRGK